MVFPGIHTVVPVQFVQESGAVNTEKIRVELVDAKGNKVGDEVCVRACVCGCVKRYMQKERERE